MVRDEGEKIQDKELKNMFEIWFSLRNTKEKHDKDKGIIFLHPQLKKDNESEQGKQRGVTEEVKPFQ